MGVDKGEPAPEPRELQIPGTAADPSTWTTVKRKSNAKRNNADLPALIGNPSYLTISNSIPASVADIVDSHSRYAAEWQASPVREKFEQIVRDNFEDSRSISQAICLGIGSFSKVELPWMAKRCCHMQYCGFLALVDVLEKYTRFPISRVFQEPEFTESDRQFIVGNGHRVVDTPAAFRLVDRNTLIFGVHLYHATYREALTNCLPAMFVGTGWDSWEGDMVDFSQSDMRDVEPIREMHRRYQRFTLPTEKPDHTFNNTVMYWRPAVRVENGTKVPWTDDPKVGAPDVEENE